MPPAAPRTTVAEPLIHAFEQAEALKATGVEIISIAVGDFSGTGIQFINKISSAPSS
eukprot:gene228-8912_t